MAYYQGDYYRGDYYQGFPFLAAAIPLGKRLLGKALPKVGGKIGGLIGKVAGRGGRVLKTGAGVAAGGAAFELGSRAVRGGGADGMRRRRMNVANVKALRRAIRRAHGFAKLSRKVMTYPIVKPPKGRALFKKSRRR